MSKHELYSNSKTGTTSVLVTANSEPPAISDFDPSVPIPYWHQNLELATLCIANSVSLTIIIARLWIRYSPSKPFRKDDYWIAGAGAALVFPHWICQLATNRYGSGLHVQNVPEHRLEMYWQFSRGWIGYYLVCSMIKVSVCYCLLQILPESYRAFRLMVRGISFAIMGLGVAISLVWIFQCRPFLSNFVFSVEYTWCANMDAARFAWIGLSVGFDAVITWIPFVLVKRVQVEPYKRNALMVVFGANLLGSITCLIGIYGVWANRSNQSGFDLTYSATPFVIINDIEILMYTIGASATVASKYLVSKAGTIAGFVSSSRMAVVSWRKGYKGDDLERQSRVQTRSEQYVRQNSDNVELIEVRLGDRKLQRGAVKSTATGGGR